MRRQASIAEGHERVAGADVPRAGQQNQAFCGPNRRHTVAHSGMVRHVDILARTTSLLTYPIKGCAGISHTAAEVGRRGLAFDREWMVVDSDGQFVTQRQAPSLSLITPTLTDEALQVAVLGVGNVVVPLKRTHRDLRLVTVWRDTCAATDEGDEVAALLSEHIGRNVRLVRMAEDHERGVPGTNAETGFADAFPLLVISEASLADLNGRIADLGGQAVPIGRFRPNIVVGGCAAYAEDSWEAVRIGDVSLEMAGPCERCTVTTVDQSTGTPVEGGEPLATLATYRRGRGGVVFGQNAVHRGVGVVSVREPVHVA
jgi:uncharacterized protein